MSVVLRPEMNTVAVVLDNLAKEFAVRDGLRVIGVVANDDYSRLLGILE